ncbi:MAG TPA: amino acid ABC transporter substrate-binding protein [Acetobacteraceae bacterium]|nr:amino acid ABC transporter substrate-binding protein [Acetobacteraceae bacterium]
MPATSRVLALLGATLLAASVARAAQPITIGFDTEETGGLAPNGKAALLAQQIWVEHINAKGGLLGRPVKLVYYDDQSNPSLVPGIVTKLLDVDKVDILIGGNGTNMLAPAMPIVMQHNLTFLGLFGLDVNSEFHYKNYFSIIPAGGTSPREAFSQGFFAVAAAMNPKPKTIALVGADSEFSKNAVDGARAQAKRMGLKVVYDQTYPPDTPDYTPIVRAIQATHPDIVYVGSYPTDTVGMVRAAGEVGLKTRMFGGGMVGLQSTAIKMQLGALLNGIEDYDFWQPVKGYATPEAMAFLKKFQAKAGAEGVDPLGYYVPPFAYADMQVLGDAITGTGSLDQKKLADYLRSHTFHTVAGDIKFGPNGEWTEPRVLAVQFRGVAGHGLDQFRGAKTEVVLWPPALQTGTLQSPYDGAKH